MSPPVGDSSSAVTPAQEAAATRMLREAFGPVLAFSGGGESAFRFWGPRIARAVLDAKDDPVTTEPAMSQDEKNRILGGLIAELEAMGGKDAQ